MISGAAFLNTIQLKEQLLAKFYTYLPKVIGAVIIFAVGYILIKIIDKAVRHFFDKVDFERTIEIFIERTLNTVLYIILILVILSNFGINVSGFIAGLGIMGFVVGFALKDTLGNLAAGILLLIYKPFKVGEWINVDGIVGGVQEIGIAACVLNSPDNTKITIPNSRIWGGPIQNYHGNPTRKLFNITIGISYSDDIEKAIKVIRGLLNKDERVFKDPEPQIEVKDYGDSSINITVRPTVKKEHYWDVYFSFMRNIKKEFDKHNISIPFPQRDVHLYQKNCG
jgi:small conductance mechanosensitive channel